MIYKSVGKTGKEISTIAFGAMRFVPEEYKKDYQSCVDILLRAHDLGVNYFDTAPLYCEGHSEPIIGQAMKQIRGKRPYVSTKCGLWMTTTADGVYEQIKKSRDNLCVDTIDFYHLWSIKTLEEYQTMIRPGGLYEGLVRAKEEGLISHICASVHIDGTGLAEIVADGKLELVTLGYNALNFAFRQVGIQACYDAGVGVVVMNPLGGGMIPRHPDMFSFLKTAPDESIVQAALRFVIGHKEVTAALPGPASIAELEECVSAADRISEVTEATRESLAKHLRQDLDTLCTSCGYCMPECPAQVPIVPLLTHYNELILSGNPEETSARLPMIWGLGADQAAKCIHCGLCEGVCTQKLPIMDRLDEIAGWLEKYGPGMVR
ncbi:MAG: aldo/keto reductase [Oscillospiraceae bacterium]|nr:aldo/keto reductase [Oscillospiraceae bacterium]